MLKILGNPIKSMTASLETTVQLVGPLTQQQRWFAFPPFRVMRRHPLSRRSSLTLLKSSYGQRYARKSQQKVILSRCNWLVRVIRENFYTLGRGRKNPHVIPGLNQKLPSIQAGTRWMRRLSEYQPREVSEEFVQKKGLDKEAVKLWSFSYSNKSNLKNKSSTMESWGPIGSGFTSFSIEGRSVGTPILPDGRELEGFRSVILFNQSIAHMSTGGRVHGLHVIVAVGNGNGIAGWAIAGSTHFVTAANHARNRAALRLQHIPVCDGHTIFHDMIGQEVRSVVKLERRPRGYGLRCGRTIREICKLVGIKDMRSKVMMNRNPLRVIPCVFKLLVAQETHQALADKTGLHVVEYSPENSYFPKLVASPSDGNVREGTEHVVDMYDSIKHKLSDFYPYSM